MSDNNKSKKTNNKKSSAKKTPAKKTAAPKAPVKKAETPKPADLSPHFVKAEEFVNAVLDNVSEANTKVDNAVKKQKRSIKRFFKKLFK